MKILKVIFANLIFILALVLAAPSIFWMDCTQEKGASVESLWSCKFTFPYVWAHCQIFCKGKRENQKDLN